MNLDSGAGLLHRLTEQIAERPWDEPVDDPRVRHDLVRNDPQTRPPATKAYAGLPVLPLPRELPEPGVAMTVALAGHPAPAQRPDAAQLGRVLFLGAGVVRYGEWNGRRFPFRAAGSAGARFPLELYASTRGVDGVPDGVYWYDPQEHGLVRVGPAAAGETTTLVVTGVPWRTGWRYAERGWRHIYWDAGTLLSQLSVAATSAGWTPRIRSLFPDAQVQALVGADGVHEFPAALLTLGDGEPAIAPAAPGLPGELPAVEFPLVTAAQRAGDRSELGEPWPAGAPLPDAPAAEPVGDVILRRGSTRLMDPARTLPRELLDWPMRAALRGIDVPHWIVVHGVDGLAPGVYRWPDLDAPVHAGDLREEMLRIGLGQGLPRDAAYVAVGAVAPDTVDDRGYRTAQLQAGVVEGRLHLAAYALGAGASGMTFLDPDVPPLLGAPADTLALLFTCVGAPEYRNRRGGGPGAAAPVRMVTPRVVD